MAYSDCTAHPFGGGRYVLRPLLCGQRTYAIKVNTEGDAVCLAIDVSILPPSVLRETVLLNCST
jgi:hypothetical protein